MIYLAGALFFTYGPEYPREWVAYGGMSLILTWVAYRYQRISNICLHMTLNALMYYQLPNIPPFVYWYREFFFHDKL